MQTRALITTAAFVFTGTMAGGQTTNLLSSDTGGSLGNGNSFVTTGQAVSYFGTEVVFVSDATDLVAGDTQGFTDVFVRNRQTGTTTRVSVNSSGQAANGASGWAFAGQSGGAAMLGRYVVFASDATNLDVTKTSPTADLFLHDRDTDLDGVFDEPGSISTIRITRGVGGTEPNGNSTSPMIGASTSGGIRVVYTSSASNLVANDTNGVADIFRYDSTSGTTARINVGPFGEATGGHSSGPVISAGGSQIYFTSEATNLVADDNSNSLPDDDTNGKADVFVYDTVAGAVSRVGLTNAGSEASGGHSIVTSASATGRYFVFESDATNLVTGDTNSATDVFLRDRDTDNDGILDESGATSTVRVSLPTGAGEGNGASTDASIDAFATRVAFVSAATNLVAGDIDGPNRNVYLRDLGTGVTTMVAPLPGGTPAQVGIGFRRVSLSPEGGTVAYAASNVSPQQVYLHDMQTIDTDGDALVDSWEVVGIDSNQDGVIDLTLPNANPWVRDVYVECDAMVDANGVSMLPSANTLAAIQQRFTGVDQSSHRLHLLLDPSGTDLNLPNAIWSANFSPLTWPPEFGPFKQANFGTPAERVNPNWVNIRAAKLLAHRYCVFADQNASNSISGMGEMPGNDFFLTLGGAWAWWGSSPGVQAGVFLHELGHNLGLDHGGGQGIASAAQRASNYKPNYYSVMNYTWTTPSNGFASSWRGTLSNATFNVLNEGVLDEATGIGGYPGFVTVAGGPPMRLVNLNGPVNWNRNATCCEFGVNEDINRLNTPMAPSPLEVLQPHNDWLNLRYQLGGHPNFNSFTHGATIPTDEYDFNVFQMLQGVGDFSDGLDNYVAGEEAHVVGGWETWCDGGAPGVISSEQFRSPPNALKIAFDGVGSSDVARRFEQDSGRWTLSMWTYVPSGATGSAYVLGLNTYCEPDHNWSMQVRFNANNSRVISFDGTWLPMARDRWAEFRVEIDLDLDQFSEYYDGVPLATGMTWSQHVSGSVGDPGLPRLRALDLYAQSITSMFVDDFSLIRFECEADFNGDGFVNTGDFIDFLNAFVAGEPEADFNGDGFINTGDFIDFLNAFVSGCEF